MRPPSLQFLRAFRVTEFCPAPCAAPRATCSPPKCSPAVAGSPSKFTLHKTRPLRSFSSATIHRSSQTPKTSDRGPPSKEDTQTDFGSMNVLGNTPAPTTAIDACLSDGFHFDSGLKIGGGSGCLLVGGEAFSWRPWDAGGGPRGSRKGRMINKKGQWDIENEAWGTLDLVWPKPGRRSCLAPLILLARASNFGNRSANITITDLLILGLGPHVHPISPETRDYINSLGIRVDIQDTRNAAAQFNLLATERGVGEVAAALIPIGWKEPR